jgi:HECT-domain (ubiquitin-transferase)
MFSHFGEELQSGLLDMLVPTQNAIHRTGVVHDLWVPNPKRAAEPDDKQFFEFIGGFIGFCFRHEQKLSLQLPSVVYKTFSGSEIAWTDLRELDMLQYDHLMDLHAHPMEKLGKFFTHWVVHGVSGAEMELCSGGKEREIK